MSLPHLHLPPSATRGCGSRKKGGIYAETLLSAKGRPLEDFLFDPPLLLPLEELGVTPRGVKIFTAPDGATHILDWVGERYYPYVADFVEEVRRMGMSRRLPRTLDFSRLDSRSRVILIHARAWIENAAEYFAAMGQPWPPVAWDCPKKLQEHMREGNPPQMCAGLWWWDVPADRAIPDQPAVGDFALGWRDMPSFSYLARSAKTLKGTYRPAAFAALPITRLAVIRDDDQANFEAALRAAQRASLEVEVCDE